MKRVLELPEPPRVNLRVVDDLSTDAGGFLRRVSRRLVAQTESGEEGPAFIYDEVDRAGIDAVVVLAYFLAPGPSEAEVPWVILRSAVRPPVALRQSERSPMIEPVNRGLWELPAGLVEADEISPEGLQRAAARELEEETGFRVAPSALVSLGPSGFPSPGMAAERQFFFQVEVDPDEVTAPSLDGSALESLGEVIAVPLSVALLAASAGRLPDSKTELCLRRFSEAQQRPAQSN